MALAGQRNAYHCQNGQKTGKKGRPANQFLISVHVDLHCCALVLLRADLRQIDFRDQFTKILG